MHTIAVGISPATGRAINWNADGLEEDAVGRARRHARNKRYTRKVLSNQLLGRNHDLRIQRWRYGDGSDGRHGRHLDAGISDGGPESLLRSIHRLSWEDAAVDVGGGALWQCIVCMSTAQQCGDASGAQHAVVAAILVNDGLGCLIV